jgi:ketosteroid isomerase-like protein
VPLSEKAKLGNSQSTVKRLLAAALLTAGVAMLATWAHRKLAGEQSGESLLRDYLEAWQTGDTDRLEKIVADDYTGHVNAIAGVETRDRRELAAQVRAHAETYREARFELEDCIANGSRVAARARMEGTHGEDGRDVEMEGMLILRTEGGRIAEEWASWDYLGVAQQLGVELKLEPGE